MFLQSNETAYTCCVMARTDLQAKGDKDLFDRLSADRNLKRAIKKFNEDTKEQSARKQLLATSVRLVREMAPDIIDDVEACRKLLDIDDPIECFVYPEQRFNAAAVKPEGGRLFLMFSAGLLESFSDDELRFVIGHELGHHMFKHHEIPVAGLLSGKFEIDAQTLLSLFSWQRYAEISCDRAGLVCAEGGLETATAALFKISSGLTGNRVKLSVDTFLGQLADLKEETDRLRKADKQARAEWFSTHPFSPLRVHAAVLFAKSAMLKKGGMALLDVEVEVDKLMALMSPGYLNEKSDAAEAMRRLLLAGGVIIAHSSGIPNEESLAAIRSLLGEHAVSDGINPKALEQELESRIARVKEDVVPLNRIHVVRDLCLIARANGGVSDTERELLFQIARSLDVDDAVITQHSSGTSESLALS